MKNIDVGYFNFCKVNNFGFAQKNLDLFALKSSELEISLPKLNLHDGQTEYSDFSKTLNTRWKTNVVNSWQVIISEIELILNIENKNINSPYVQNTFQTIGHLNHTHIPKLAIFHFDAGTPMSGNSLLHGGSLNTIKNTFSIIGINQNYPELLIHELFHFIGAEEGYDTKSFKTDDNCYDCWMQFQPNMGHTLCMNHQTQVKSFLDSLSRS